ncbi:MAG: Hpt domain-containing protein, partial [Gammaproteobacteria bacterium]
AEEVLTTIQDAYPQWCRDTENHDALKEIRRAFHTLKGSGRMVGAQVVGEVSWAIENLLNRVIDRAITASPLVFALIEKTLECLPLLVDSFKQQQPTPVDVRGLTETAHLAAMGNRQINVKGMERLSEGSVREGAQEGEAEAASLANLAGLDPVLVEIFREEAAGHLAVVHEFLSESGGIDASPTNELLRALHTLKGCANMAGITAVSDVVTPLERFIKRIHRCNHFVDPALQNFLERCIQALNQALDGLMADPHRPVLPQEAFILELKSHIMRTLSERESEGIFEGVDCLSVSPFVTKIFLTKGVDKLLDAGHFLSSYRANPAELAPELNALYQQLALLRVSAQDAGIPEVVDLCRGLEYAYRSVESGATRVDDAFFATAHEAHDRLIDMMDNLANGLSIVSPEALSSRLLAFVPPEKIAEYNALPKPEILSSNRAHYVDNESEEVSIAPETSDKKISKNDALEVNVDPEVIDIFLDEAIDIMESAANLLRDWQQDNSNLLCVKELQRDLHTLKGGAHLADIRPVGELANRLEALYEGICDNRFEIKNELFELLNACHGSIGDMMTALRNGQTLPDPQVWLDAADDYLEQHSYHFDYEALEPETGALLPESSPEALPERPAAESMDEDGVSDAEPDAAAEASVSEKSVSMDTDFSPSSSSSSSSVSGERVSPLQTLLGDDFDNLDIEVFSIFLEEAEELTEQADDALQAWLAEPKNSEHGHVLKRVVHTFKGGARLAGLSALGDLSHDFETFLEGMPIGVPDAAFLQETQRRFDQVVQWATNLRTVVQQHEDGEQVALSAAPEHVPESTTETAENDRVERDASLDEPLEPQFSLPVSPLPFSSLPSSSEDSSIVAHVRNESGDDVRRDEHESNAASASVEAKTPDPVPLVRTAAGLPLHHAVTVPHKVEMPSMRRELKAGRRGGESVK